MKHNKKAVELSMNFMVTLIIAIVLFSMGIKFAYDLVAKGEKLEDMSQADLDKRIEQLFCGSNELFCTSASSKTIERGKAHIFSITVHNIRQPRDFKLAIDLASAHTKNNDPIDISTYPLSWLPTEKSFSLEANENEKTGLRVEVPKKNPAGTYILNVDVLYNDAGSWIRYDATKKIYITVP